MRVQESLQSFLNVRGFDVNRELYCNHFWYSIGVLVGSFGIFSDCTVLFLVFSNVL